MFKTTAVEVAAKYDAIELKNKTLLNIACACLMWKCNNSSRYWDLKKDMVAIHVIFNFVIRSHTIVIPQKSKPDMYS